MSENISTFVSKLKSNPDILGIILFGSWARGNQRPDSDVDLLVIQKKGFKRTVEYHCNLAFEITYTTKRGAIDFWRANRDDCAELWNVGQVLYDKCGVVEELRKVGDQIIAQGKQPFPQTQLEHLRFDAEDQLRAIRELYREDSATAQLILGHKLFALTELFFDIRQLWIPPPKQRLEKLRELDPPLYKMLVNILTAETNFERKLQITQQVVDKVFSYQDSQSM